MAGVPILSAESISGKTPKDNDLQEFGVRLISSLSECGFVILTNHGIGSDTVRGALESAAAFFELSEAEKVSKFPRCPSGHGYISRGKESIDMAREDVERLEKTVMILV